MILIKRLAIILCSSRSARENICCGTTPKIETASGETASGEHRNRDSSGDLAKSRLKMYFGIF